MVNYLYDLDDIEKNHEAYAEGPTVVASSAVQRLLRPPLELVAGRRLGLSVYRDDSAAGHAVVRRGEKHDCRCDLFDFWPGNIVGFRHRFAIGRVSMIDGATALTKMPSLATSSASAAVSAATPALATV